MTSPNKPEQPSNFDPTLLENTFNRLTKQGPEALGPGGDLIPRKRITFEVDGAECAPGVFEGTFQITLASLTADQEISISRGVTDPAEVVQLTVKHSIERMNGAPVVGDQLNFLWEALGPGGRHLVSIMFQEIGSLNPAALGKAQASSTRS